MQPCLRAISQADLRCGFEIRGWGKPSNRTGGFITIRYSSIRPACVNCEMMALPSLPCQALPPGLIAAFLGEPASVGQTMACSRFPYMAANTSPYWVGNETHSCASVAAGVRNTVNSTTSTLLTGCGLWPPVANRTAQGGSWYVATGRWPDWPCVTPQCLQMHLAEKAVLRADDFRL
jgi:hypothetical protein